MSTGLPQAPLAGNLKSGVGALGQGQAKFLDFHLSFGFEFGPKTKQKGRRKTKGEAKNLKGRAKQPKSNRGRKQKRENRTVKKTHGKPNGKTIRVISTR